MPSSATSIASDRLMMTRWRWQVRLVTTPAMPAPTRKEPGDTTGATTERSPSRRCPREQHDVSGLVCGEDVTESKVAGHVDEAGRERQRRERPNKRMTKADRCRR